MYLSPTEIRQTRLDTLDNLHVASRAWVEATEKLSGLALRAGRQALDEGRSRLEALADTTRIKFDAAPLERLADWRDDSAGLAREYFEIIGSAHQAILQIAREQVAVLDKALNKQLDHAARHVDATGEAAIGHVKTAIRQAEAGFNDMADAAAQGAELVEEQVRQVSEALSAPADGAEPAAPRSRRTRASSSN